MATCDAQDLLDAGKCFGCLDRTQSWQAMLALLCSILQNSNPMATCDVNELLSAGKCFDCLNDHQMAMVGLELACEILQGGGTGGTSCNLCGTADPVAAPTCDCSIYTRTDTAELWYWNPATATWVKILSNT